VTGDLAYWGAAAPVIATVLSMVALGGGVLAARGRVAEWVDARVKHIVAEAFTGRAEADHLLRANHLAEYREELRRALTEHEARERAYMETLRDAAHRAEQHADRIAAGVGIRLGAIERDLERVRGELGYLRAELARLTPKTGA
jgi:hypothetical protein